ncbi:MAG: 3-dehydroquinate synthase, partial [Candidatus Omnitrophica bacterium]|nr:3-dehydroquinate synthase [Candidatus Omnitrophota bacterium]
GSFYQPKAVICDIALLRTLPKKEIKNGLAEVIKYGIIHDRKFFEYLEKNLKNILALRKPCIEYVVWKCACIKAEVVEKDEFDTKGIRAILNFGHTFGHAIEASFKYSKKFTHGEAVATGMILAGNTALKLNMIKLNEVNKIRKIIKRANLPLNLKGANAKKIIETIDYDKKFLHGVNRFVLPRRIGVVEIVQDVPEILIRTVLGLEK